MCVGRLLGAGCWGSAGIGLSKSKRERPVKHFPKIDQKLLVDRLPLNTTACCAVSLSTRRDTAQDEMHYGGTVITQRGPGRAIVILVLVVCLLVKQPTAAENP